MRHVSISIILAIATTLSYCGAACSASYQFVKVADVADAPAGTFKLLRAAAGNQQTAFYSNYNSQTRSGVFFADGGPLVSIAKSGDPAPGGTFPNFEFAFGRPSISGGLVAFTAFNTVGQGTGVFAGSGGPLTTIAKLGDAAPTGTFQSFGDGASVHGTNVAFSASYPGKTGLFIGNGGPLTTLPQTGDAGPLGTFTALSEPKLSGDTVAFRGSYSGGQGIFTTKNGTITTLAKTGDVTPLGALTQLSDLSFVGDTVAFLGRVGMAQGVFMSNGGGSLTTVAKVGDVTPYGTWRNLFSSISASQGQVAFRGDYTNGVGIFVSDGVMLTPVLKSGDALLGSTLTSMQFIGGGLDVGGSGTVAFGYYLANGDEGVALAIPVPEPATGALASALAAVRMARRRQRAG
jgi:hypothetical protein